MEERLTVPGQGGMRKWIIGVRVWEPGEAAGPVW